MLNDLVHGRTLLIVAENLDELLQGVGEKRPAATAALHEESYIFRDAGLQPDPLNDYFELGNPCSPASAPADAG